MDEQDRVTSTAARSATAAGTATTTNPAQPSPAPRRHPPASDTARFAALVRAVSAEARRLGLQVPGFRSPPRLVGVDRSLRRRPGAAPSVAVRLAGRSHDAVLADVVEGVIVANALTDAAAAHARHRLLTVAAAMRQTAA